MTRAAKTASRQKRTRSAVMGAGNWGSNLIRVVERMESTDLLLVADPDPKKRQAASEAAPGARIVSEILEAMDDFEAVFVATPSVDHFAHARFLTEAGKDVLIEKPFAMSLDDAVTLKDKAARAGTVLMVGHQMLFHQAFERLKSLVAEGSLGRLLSICAERSGALDFQREPGVLWAYGPHDASMILALAGEEPSSVSASGETSNGRADSASSVDLSLEFQSGLTAKIYLGAGREKRRRIEVRGELATAVFDDTVPGGSLTLVDGAPDAADKQGRPVSFVSKEPLALECRHFARCVQSRTAPRTGGYHAVQVTRILDLAARALLE